MFEFIKKQRNWFFLGFGIGFLLSLSILLLAFFFSFEGLIVLSTWLNEILVNSGPVVLSAVFVGLSWAAGVAGSLVIGGISGLQLIADNTSGVHRKDRKSFDKDLSSTNSDEDGTEVFKTKEDLQQIKDIQQGIKELKETGKEQVEKLEKKIENLERVKFEFHPCCLF